MNTKPFDLSGRTVLVTGGTSGIGLACVERLAEYGAKVVTTYLEGKEDPETILQGLSKIGDLQLEPLDLRSGDSIKRCINNVINQRGNLDVLVNNAGVTDDALFLRMRESQWDNVIDINLKGTFRITKAFIRHMVKARKGKIIFLSSVVAASGNAGQVNYSASKAGIEAMCKSIAREVSHRGITVNCVAPGFISTEMTDNLPVELKEKLAESIPMNRFGSPQDVAEAVFFLSSENANYITGTVLNVNGGMLMS